MKMLRGRSSLLFVLFCGNYIHSNFFFFATAFESIANPHDKLQCKPSWDLPLVYTDSDQQALDYNFEFGLFNYTPPTQTNGANPLKLQEDFMPQQHHQLLLDCSSAVAVGRQSCNGRLRPACDAFCEAQCQVHCSFPALAQELADCLAANTMAGCYYRVDHTLELKARAACRRVFSNEIKSFPHIDGDSNIDSTTAVPPTSSTTASESTSITYSSPTTIVSTDSSGTETSEDTSIAPTTSEVLPDITTNLVPGIELTDVTVYVIEVDSRGLKEVNWKRLLRAALIMGLEHDFELDPLAPEYGNLVDLTSNVTIESCNAPYNQILYSPLDRPDRLVYTTKLGASYYVTPSSTTTATNIASHITPILTSHTSSSSLQLRVWWPGNQPKFSNTADFTTEDVSLKVTFQGYPAHYMSTEGFTILPSSASHTHCVFLLVLGPIWFLVETVPQWI
eukprot:Protomagalhaensia_wolfi_Nauph_80__193@NODE_1104_length_1732_cov_222_412286_g840_i0_p1_GENE_NODE_1104_length_1732_cov_222_412286_g840_i0NODE_1104_length_1732_cov_222_412286_g840_i0_p1_ORF_typecomplete_len449_score68_43_NODE_1104_length_1732_cov_222_412286_g840_i01271473